MWSILEVIQDCWCQHPEYCSNTYCIESVYYMIENQKNIISCILHYFFCLFVLIMVNFYFFKFQGYMRQYLSFLWKYFYYGKFQKHIKIEITVQQNFMDLLHNINHFNSGPVLFACILFCFSPFLQSRLRQT